MRCIRLRKNNIQIGEEYTLQNFFSEPRGIYYFIGEIFAVDKNLIPNSQRDYFVESPARRNFEEILEDYFREIWKICHTASKIRGAKKAIKKYKDANDDFARDCQESRLFTNPAYIAQAKFELDALEDEAKDAEAKIECRIEDALENPATALSRVVLHLTENNAEISVPRRAVPPPPRTVCGVSYQNSRAG